MSGISETISQTFTGLTEWGVAGSYFKLMSTVNPVDVILLKDGKIVHQAKQVQGGHYQTVDFDRVKITTGGNEAVTFLYAPAQGGSDRVVSSSTITGPLGSDNADAQAAAGASGLVLVLSRLQAWNGATFDRLQAIAIGGVKALAAAVYGTLGALAQIAVGGVNALVTTERGYIAGANFASSTALGATTNETVFAPASNVNGAFVKFRSAYTETTVVNAPTTISLLAKASAPASAIDGELLLGIGAHTCQVQSGESGKYAASEGRRFIAAGKGLYFRNSGAAEVNGLRAVDYELL